MYIYSECKDNINKNLDIINQIKMDNIKTLMRLHGTYASGRTLYISDTDIEYFIKYEDDIKKIKAFFQYFIKELYSHKQFIFVKAISGLDDRFRFPFNILKNGTIIGYDYSMIKTRLDLLLKQSVINQNEYDNIMKYVVQKPTLITFEKLKLVLEDFNILFWTFDELSAGKKEYRGKTFTLEETLLYPNFPTVLTSILEFDDNKYVDVDLSMFLYINKVNTNSNITKNITFVEFDKNIILLNDITRVNTTQHYYHGVFKNYVQMKYLKLIKRIRSILSSYSFGARNTVNLTYEEGKNPKYKGLIFKIRNEISDYYNTEIGIFNQIKNRIGDVIFLIGIKEEMQIKQLIVEILKDLLTTSYSNKSLLDEINNELKKKKYDKDKLKKLMKQLGEDVMKQMNDRALPFLIKIYNQIKFLLPFKLELPFKNNK